MKRILLVGDFACTTGFARVLENIARHLQSNWNIDVLAINYHGDAHPLQKSFRIYPANLEGDVYGINRFPKFVTTNQYDLIFILNDIWIIDMYLETIKNVSRTKRPPIVFYTPVDAKHLKPNWVAPLNQCDHAVFYTEFGKNEALLSGLKIPVSVIPHGVDMQMFHFLPQKTARKETSFPDDWYVTAMVNRNQPRKRLDLGIYFFSEWVKRTNKPDTVKLYYHGALQDMGIDILDYAQYCGIDNRMIVTSHNMTLNSMLPADKLKFVYNSADVYFTPCTSEGWSLTLHEAMACAIPCIVPNSSAMAEWPKGAVEYIDIVPNLPTVNTGMVNTIMDTPSLDSFIEKAELLYNNPQYRKDLGFKGFKRATESRFKWSTITTQFEAIFDQLVKGKK